MDWTRIGTIKWTATCPRAGGDEDGGFTLEPLPGEGLERLHRDVRHSIEQCLWDIECAGLYERARRASGRLQVVGVEPFRAADVAEELREHCFLAAPLDHHEAVVVWCVDRYGRQRPDAWRFVRFDAAEYLRGRAAR